MCVDCVYMCTRECVCGRIKCTCDNRVYICVYGRVCVGRLNVYVDRVCVSVSVWGAMCG